MSDLPLLKYQQFINLYNPVLGEAQKNDGEAMGINGTQYKAWTLV